MANFTFPFNFQPSNTTSNAAVNYTVPAGKYAFFFGHCIGAGDSISVRSQIFLSADATTTRTSAWTILKAGDTVTTTGSTSYYHVAEFDNIS